MVIKFVIIDFETGLWLIPQVINKLLENGKKYIFYEFHFMFQKCYSFLNKNEEK